MAQRDASTPQRTGEADRPENAILGEEWGEPEPGAVHGINHTRRGEEGPEARFQGAKTRKAAKDRISRRG